MRLRNDQVLRAMDFISMPDPNPADKVSPWLLDSTAVKVIGGSSAKVLYEDGEDFVIEFHDCAMSVVQAYLPKKEFSSYPTPVREGTVFSLIVFIANDHLRVGAWPLPSYWHPSLRK